MKRNKLLTLFPLCLAAALFLVAVGCKKTDTADAQKDHLSRIRERGTLIIATEGN